MTSDKNAPMPEQDNDDDELAAALADVSKFCLAGEPVPNDLAALWRAQLNDDTELLDAYELTLLDDLGPELFDGFRESDGVDAPTARAFARMTAQVRWVAEIGDGDLLGYWVGERGRPLAESPIVVCDPDGQFELGARTLAEYLLDCADPEDPDDFIEVRNALEQLGVGVRVRNQQEIWDRLDGFDEPNSVTLGYLVEERMRDR